MKSRKDIHSPANNDITEQDIDDAMEVTIGHILKGIPYTYANYGPPPLEFYLQNVQNTFRAGFAMGYRRAHVDCTVTSGPE